MVKGIAQKIETLSDGSIKISIYVNKELIQQAFPLAYKEVYISEMQEEIKEDRNAILTSLKETFEKGVEILAKEFKEVYGTE